MNLETPASYYAALATLIYLFLEAFLVRQKKPWAIPAMVSYLTIGLWYFTEVWYTPERLLIFSASTLELAYYQVAIFLISFRVAISLIVPYFKKRAISKNTYSIKRLNLKPQKLLITLIILWLVLFIFGVSRLDWDFSQALLPQGGRWAPRLWNRAGVGQGYDFLVSAASYTYSLICALFGVLFFIQNRMSFKILALIMMVLSWPAFYLSGARNSFLAVIMPGYFTYLLITRQKIWVKIIMSASLLLVINYLFIIVITFRNSGITNFFQGDMNQSLGEKHQGLNMLEELLFINTYYSEDKYKLAYGMDYLAEVFNMVPRLIFPNKPLIGYQYNLLRSPDGNINATIAAGIIGRGVMNFGPLLGAVFPAFLMAMWVGFLSQLWIQRFSILRLSLFLVGIGITPNLGRDITLLILWPVVFGYILVVFLEKRFSSKSTTSFHDNVSITNSLIHR